MSYVTLDTHRTPDNSDAPILLKVYTFAQRDMVDDEDSFLLQLTQAQWKATDRELSIDLSNPHDIDVDIIV